MTGDPSANDEESQSAPIGTAISLTLRGRLTLAQWRSEFLRPLRVAGFPNVASAFALNELGNWLGEIALAVLVFDRTHSALATAGLFLAARVLPALIGPALSARFEHLAGTRVLPALHLAEAVVFGALALLAGHSPAVWLIVLAALDGILAISARALLWAATAGLLAPHDLLRQGNAVLNGGFAAAGAIGPVLGGALVAGIGLGPALGLDAASFAAAALILGAARSLPIASDSPEIGWRQRLRKGLNYALGQPRVRDLLAWQGLVLVFFTLVVPVEIVFVKAQLHAGNAGYGALLASWGTGMIAGAGLFAVSHRFSVRWVLALSSIAIGVGYLGIAASPNLLLACCASFVGGVGNGTEWIALLTALQAATAPDRQVIVMALFESLSTVVPGIGFALGGVIAAAYSPRTAYVVAGCGVLLLLAVAAARTARQRAGADSDTRPDERQV